MSGSHSPEPMDTEPTLSADTEKDKTGAEVVLSVRWSEGVQPQKCLLELEKILQTWANNRKIGDCKVLKVLDDGRAVVKFNHSPAVSDLQCLTGQTLTKKRDVKTVTIESVSLMPLELKTQTPDDAAVALPHPSISERKDEKSQLVDQSSATAREETCTIPVGHFWYVCHVYKEEIKRIQEENGVKIMADVKVTIEADQKHMNAEKALSDFINLVQRCLGESDGSVIPLKDVDPDEWKNALKIMHKKENKLLFTLSSEEMIICGPRQTQDAVMKNLNGNNTNMSSKKSTWESQDTSLKIGMKIKDPLVDAGLTMDKKDWMLMTASFGGQVARIKDKFGVDFQESRIRQDKVQVKAHYRRSGGNTSMESHAVRALLHLYQKTVTSPMNFLPQYDGATGFSDSLNGVYQSEGASSGPSGYSTHDMKGPTGGATGEDDKDERCPICMGDFIKKKRLKCKHEFCEECLIQAEKSCGPTCPVCKDVFGKIVGDQPDGKMSSYFNSLSLPGFPRCGTIVINYEIPGGRQTEKHPNPGQLYTGTRRTAYLPDNKEGREVLHLLQTAFDQRLIFTVGTSRMTGMENQVTWNDIHHKTSTTGGPESFGYPDPDYLSRVKDELKAKGIK